jgi:hypothetical protein
MDVSQAQRLKAMEDENCLKLLVAEREHTRKCIPRKRESIQKK